MNTTGIEKLGLPTPDDYRPTPKNAPITDPTPTPDLRSQYADLIQKALQEPKNAVFEVEQAKKAIQDGTLDTPENILQAALNLVKHGI